MQITTIRVLFMPLGCQIRLHIFHGKSSTYKNKHAQACLQKLITLESKNWESDRMVPGTMKAANFCHVWPLFMHLYIITEKVHNKKHQNTNTHACTHTHTHKVYAFTSFVYCSPRYSGCSELNYYKFWTLTSSTYCLPWYSGCSEQNCHKFWK